jgi:hypothetical protein
MTSVGGLGGSSSSSLTAAIKANQAMINNVFRIGHRGTGAAAVSAINYWLPQEGVANGECNGLFPNRKDR